IEIASKKGATVFDTDEFVKHGVTTESLAALKPAFNKEGTVTAGNASGLNDGAAAVVLMKASRAKELGLKPLAKIKAYSSAGIDPKIMGMGPVPASELYLRTAGWKHQDVDLMEINEAFAAQAIGVNKQMGWDTSKINVNGGAIAIGHPNWRLRRSHPRHTAARDDSARRGKRAGQPMYRRRNGRRPGGRALTQLTLQRRKQMAKRIALITGGMGGLGESISTKMHDVGF